MITITTIVAVGDDLLNKLRLLAVKTEVVDDDDDVVDDDVL